MLYQKSNPPIRKPNYLSAFSVPLGPNDVRNRFETVRAAMILAFCASKPLIRAFACCSLKMMKGRPYSSYTRLMVMNEYYTVVSVTLLSFVLANVLVQSRIWNGPFCVVHIGLEQTRIMNSNFGEKQHVVFFEPLERPA